MFRAISHKFQLQLPMPDAGWNSKTLWDARDSRHFFVQILPMRYILYIIICCTTMFSLLNLQCGPPSSEAHLSHNLRRSHLEDVGCTQRWHHHDGRGTHRLGLWLWLPSIVSIYSSRPSIYASATYDIIGSDKGLSPVRCQAVIWANAGILSIGPLGIKFSEILIEI